MTDERPQTTFRLEGPLVLSNAVKALVIACSLSAVLSPTSAGASRQSGSSAGAIEFHRENEVSMAKMMADMHVEPTGDVDRDFVAMMVPHHQGAIDMAVAVLRHGRNPKLRRIAQQIIIEQQQEIATMLLAVGESLPESVPSPTQGGTPTGAEAPTDNHTSSD